MDLDECDASRKITSFAICLGGRGLPREMEELVSAFLTLTDLARLSMCMRTAQAFVRRFLRGVSHLHWPGPGEPGNASYADMRLSLNLAVRHCTRLTDICIPRMPLEFLGDAFSDAALSTMSGVLDAVSFDWLD